MDNRGKTGRGNKTVTIKNRHDFCFSEGCYFFAPCTSQKANVPHYAEQNLCSSPKRWLKASPAKTNSHPLVISIGLSQAPSRYQTPLPSPEAVQHALKCTIAPLIAKSQSTQLHHALQRNSIDNFKRKNYQKGKIKKDFRREIMVSSVITALSVLPCRGEASQEILTHFIQRGQIVPLCVG